MIASISAWVSLVRWRWMRDAGAEIARRATQEAVCADTDAIARLLAHMHRLQQTARWVPRSRCLDRALALIEWADVNGIPAQLRVGVVRVSGESNRAQLRAHAWVQSGAIILDPDPESTAQFIALEALPKHSLEFDR